MLIIRPTVSLFKRMKIPPIKGDGGFKSTTVLGDWYAKELVLGREQFILCVSSITRLSVVMKAAPYVRFPEKLPRAVEEVLKSIGVPQLLIDKELGEMEPCRLFKTCDRSIIGTLTESSKMLKHYQSINHLPSETLKIAAILNKVPSSKILECYPRDEALKAFGLKKTQRVAPLQIVEPERSSKYGHLRVVK